MNYPFVSVAVVARNAEKYIKECLESIENLDYPKDRYGVLLIDGDSTDNTTNIAKEFKRVDIIKNDKKIISAGRNLAIEKAKGEYLAFTDSDCKVDSGWLKSLVIIEEVDDKVVAVGGPNLVFDSDPTLAKVIGYMQETYLGSGGSPQSYKIKEMKSVISLANCNVIYKVDIIKNLRYNEKLNVGEDAEFNYRLKRNGFKFIYTNHAKVWHHRRSSIKSFIINMFKYGEAQAKISKMHKRLIRKYSFAPSLMLISIILAMPLISLDKLFVLPYVTLGITYILLLVYSSVYLVLKTSYAGFLSLILLPIQHMSYGIGFLSGLLK